ncbi:MAG: hypothetical protein KatS3mg092_0899 [Patescibacteria group bacterium]|nr:MAG: hypothetical protein KatS3mg092_0899 [Patescibacteria group bacterium]
MNKKEVLFIAIGIFLTVITWLIADLYHANTEQKIKDKIEIPQIENYQIKKDVLEIIENKKE